MTRMQTFANAYRAVQAFDHAAGRHALASWADENPTVYDFIVQLKRAGEL